MCFCEAASSGIAACNMRGTPKVAAPAAPAKVPRNLRRSIRCSVELQAYWHFMSVSLQAAALIAEIEYLLERQSTN